MSSYAYDSADKPSAPPPDSPMPRAPSAQYPPFASQPQPQREPSASALYTHDPHAYAQQHHAPVAPLAPAAPLAPLAPLAPPHQSSAYFHHQPKYDAHPHPPPPHAGQFRDPYIDVDAESESSIHPVLVEIGRLAVFHALNAVLGFVAFTLCVGGVASSVGLLPLCCLGVLVFRLVLYAVYGFAQLDVMLYNFISPPEDHVYVQVPANPRTLHFTGERLSPTLSAFSPLSLMALIYFCSVKFVLSTLSTVSFSMAIASPLSLLFAVLGFGHGKAFEVALGPEDIADFDSDPLLFIIATFCLFAIGVALMHLVARASREATRFFCCERFSTYRYVHQHYDPRSSSHFYPPAAAALPAYGAMDNASLQQQQVPVVVSYHSSDV